MTSRQAKIQEDTHFRIMRILQGNPDLTQRGYLGVMDRHGLRSSDDKMKSSLQKIL
jgi:hypothetical protein